MFPRPRPASVITMAVVALAFGACTAATPLSPSAPTGTGYSSACVASPKTYTDRAAAAPLTGAMPASLAGALDRAAVAAIASTQQPGSTASTQAPGTIVAVRSPDGTWVKAYGMADTAGKTPMTADLHHRIASVTKSFTATAVMQLIAEGKLSLGDHVSAYVSDVPRGDQITLGDLIVMRSGIADYFDSFLPTWIANSTVAYTPDQMLAVGYAQPPLFAPDAGFDYSNSNYLLLGKIIEKVTGQSLAYELTTRILRPLGLTGTSWPGDSATLPEPHGHGYSSVIAVNGVVQGTPDGSLVDTTNFNPAWSGAAGEMIGTVEDLLVYGRAVGTGQGLLSSSAQIDRLSSFRPGWTAAAQYGQGLICRSGWVGHGGDTLGFHTDMYYNGDIDTTVVVLLNRYPTYQSQSILSALATTLGKPIAPLD